LLLKKEGSGFTILLVEVTICVSGSDDAHPDIKLAVATISEIHIPDMPNFFIDLKWQCIKKPHLKPSGV